MFLHPLPTENLVRKVCDHISCIEQYFGRGISSAMIFSDGVDDE